MKKKYKRVWLHFGADKTGTTSIQHTFHESRQLLMEKGQLAYAPARNHVQFGSFFYEDPENYNPNIAAGISDRKVLQARDQLYINRFMDWADKTPPCDTLLFSFEGFPSMDPVAMQKMRDFCYTLTDDVKVVLYLRSPLSYAVSAMSQKVKTGRKSWGKYTHWPYQRNTQKCVSVFGKDAVILRVYASASLKNQNVVEDFCDVIGLPEALVAQLPRLQFANQSLTSAGLKLGDLLIDHLKAEKKEGKTLPQKAFFKTYGRFLCAIPGGKIKLTQSQFEEVKASSQAQCEFLEKAFGIVFQDSFEGYDCATEVPSQEDEMVSAFLSMLLNFTTHVKSNISFGELCKAALGFRKNL